MIRILAAVALALLIASTGVAPAQTNPKAPGVAPAQTNAVPRASDQSQQGLTGGQLDALLAPIALYPDTLIAEILMASTYPLEVVEAQRWLTSHKRLSGAQLKAEVSKQTWDESVKSLTATPSVLQMLNDKLEWTQKLGDAVLAQQPDVMDAIQRLRKLASNKQETATTQEEGGQQVIDIEPDEPACSTCLITIRGSFFRGRGGSKCCSPLPAIGPTSARASVAHGLTSQIARRSRAGQMLAIVRRAPIVRRSTDRRAASTDRRAALTNWQASTPQLAVHSTTSARETAPCLIQTAASPVSAADFTAVVFTVAVSTAVVFTVVVFTAEGGSQMRAPPLGGRLLLRRD